MPKLPGKDLKDRIFLRGTGLIKVNKTHDGMAHDADRNTYQQFKGGKWVKVCCPDESEPRLGRSDRDIGESKVIN